MALMRNPGLRPYLDPGIQRNYSWDFVESYSDNWWCQSWPTNLYGGNPSSEQTPFAFITPAQRELAKSEVTRLKQQNTAAIYLGSLALDYAKAHPDDPDVPELLYLTLRMIRYGCDRVPPRSDTNPSEEAKGIDTIQKAASRLLRQRYATSPWTKKAAPYSGTP